MMATSISYLNGLPPRQRSYDLALSKEVSQDDVLVVVERANVTPSPTAAVWSYVVPFHLETTTGEMVPYNGTIAATVGNTSTSGTAAVDTATPSVVNGVGSSTISGDAASWLNTETATLTLTHTNLRGGTDTDTFVVTFTT